MYEDDLDDWIKVTTATGYTGYIKEIRGIRYICVHKRRKEL